MQKSQERLGGFCALEEEILLADPLQFLGLAHGLGCAGEEYTRRTQVQKPDSIDRLSSSTLPISSNEETFFIIILVEQD